MNEPKLKKVRSNITYCYCKPKPELDVCFKVSEENCRQFGIVNNVSIFGSQNAKKQGQREYFSKIYKHLHANKLLVENPSADHVRTVSDLEYQVLVVEPFAASQKELLQLPVWTADSAHKASNLGSINKLVNHQSPEVLSFIDNFSISDDAETHGFFRLIPTEAFATDIRYTESMIKTIKIGQCHRQTITRNDNAVEMLEISLSDIVDCKPTTLSAFYKRNVETFSYAIREDQMVDEQTDEKRIG